MSPSRRLAVAIGLGGSLALFGCSHSPKPVAEAGPVDEGATTRGSGTTHPRRAAPKPVPAAPTKPAPAAPAPEPNAGVVSGSSTSAPVDTIQTRDAVVPQLSADERRELEKTSREQIDAARTRLASLDATKLDTEKQRKLLIAQGFLNDAIAARTQQDWMRASQLATKARVLADELAAN
jgi:hypothetical protein